MDSPSPQRAYTYPINKTRRSHLRPAALSPVCISATPKTLWANSNWHSLPPCLHLLLPTVTVFFFYFTHSILQSGSHCQYLPLPPSLLPPHHQVWLILFLNTTSIPSSSIAAVWRHLHHHHLSLDSWICIWWLLNFHSRLQFVSHSLSTRMTAIERNQGWCLALPLGTSTSHVRVPGSHLSPSSVLNSSFLLIHT